MDRLGELILWFIVEAAAGLTGGFVGAVIGLRNGGTRLCCVGGLAGAAVGTVLSGLGFALWFQRADYFLGAFIYAVPWSPVGGLAAAGCVLGFRWIRRKLAGREPCPPWMAP